MRSGRHVDRRRVGAGVQHRGDGSGDHGAGDDARAEAGATPSAVPAPSTCDPNYAGQCLKDGIGDYDCSGGTGNGPNYVYGTVRVVGGDPFRLDADSDGLGCERG